MVTSRGRSSGRAKGRGALGSGSQFWKKGETGLDDRMGRFYTSVLIIAFLEVFMS